MSKVILFRGKAASGKTTLATEFAKLCRSALIRKDDIYDAAAMRIEAHQDRNVVSEAAIRNLVSTHISAGLNVVIDTSLNHYPLAKDFSDWVLSQGAELISFLVICSDEQIWKARLEARAECPRPNQLITDFELLKQHYQKMDTRLLDGEIVLDTSLQIELPELVQKFVKLS